jgi:HlyD family secretion protein
MQEASSINYEDLLNESGRRGRTAIIAAVVAALALAGVGYLVWTLFFSGGSAATAQAQTATVSRGNVTKSVSTSGTVAAEQTSNLNFSTSGRVTKVDVTLGQAVKQGDVLAEIDPADAQSALQSAQLSLASAQSKLDQLLQGSTASELASADQSVTQAQANYDKAVRAYNALQDPPSATDLETAQQAVVSAQAKLQSAQDARAKLDSDGQDAITAAQKGVDKAQSALDSVQQAQTNADASLSSAQGALFTVESAYCTGGGSASFCSGHDAPISSGDQQTLVGVTNSGTPDDAKNASSVLSANSAYTKAAADDQTAATAVTTAQGTLDDANTAFDKANAGPTQGDVETADAAIGSAQAVLDAANDKLNTLQSGPTADALAAAQSDIDTAAASLSSAQAKRDETYAGSTATDIQQQRQAVSQQQTSVDKAQKDLDNTKLTAPFDGTVAALNLQVGDLSGSSSGTGGGSSSSSAAIVLNTPDRVVVNLTISETDFASVKVGQTGIATFDAISGRNFPIVIDAIGTNPTTTQGVVTYSAKAHLLNGGAGFPSGGGAGAPVSPPAASTPGVDASPASGTPQPGGTPGAGFGRRRGVATPSAGGTPSADATPDAGGPPSANGTQGAGRQRGQFNGNGAGAGASTGAASTAKPIPGMNAKITIITDQRQDVLRVPTSALQRNGADETLQVRQTNGSIQSVTVQTGLADATNTEITSGVDEGATVVIPERAATTTSGATGSGAAGAGAGGGFFFGGGGGGGGRGGGGGGGGRAGGD